MAFFRIDWFDLLAVQGTLKMRCLDDITDSVGMNLGKLWDIVGQRKT